MECTFLYTLLDNYIERKDSFIYKKSKQLCQK